jgi:uncharacterized repeat protein (TIGR01451 family)
MMNFSINISKNTHKISRSVHMLAALFFVLSCIGLTVKAQTTITYSTAGTYQWCPPPGVTSITVEAWGGGGAGAQVNSGTNAGGAGGGGGAVARRNSLTVTPGVSYTITVGAAGVTGSPGTAGGDSWFGNTSTLLAKGGSSLAQNATTGATGGQASSSVGDVGAVFSGGTGANGATGAGGGGGSSAGTAAAGVNGSGSPGGIAPSGGGNGGTGSTVINTAGGTGNLPGGGGGGALRSAGTVLGGAGAPGQIKITYTLDPTVFPVVHEKSNSNNGATGTSVTVAHDLSSVTASNLLMLVGVAHRERPVANLPAAGEETSSVQFGGQNMTYLGASPLVDGGKVQTYIFMLVDPPLVNGSVVVSFSGGNLADNNQGFVGVSTFSNVDQAKPVGTFQSNFNTSNSTVVSLEIPSTNTKQMLFSILASHDEVASISATGCSDRQGFYVGGNRPNAAFYTRYAAASSTTLSYTLGTSRQWSIGGIAINPIPRADLGVTKSVNITKPYAGQQVTFTITASNATGGDLVNKVTVLDPLPNGYTWVGDNSSGAYDPESGVWSISSLAGGASATLTINVLVKITGDYANTATISGESVQDNNTTNNSASASVTICGAGGVRPIF